MKILFDGEIYSIFRHGGVIRYFHHLIAGLPPDDIPILLGNHLPDPLPCHPQLELAVKSHEWVAAGLKPVRKWLDRGYCQRKVSELAPDIIHPTYFNEVARGRYDQRKVPLVLTVYDMIHERFPERTDRRGTHSEKKRRAVDRADHIFCISHTTQLDLIERFAVPPEKTSVTLLAVDDQFYVPQVVSTGSESTPARAEERPYLLHVGRRDHYKNFDLLLQALFHLKQQSPQRELPCRLQVLGPPLTDTERQQLDELQLAQDVSWQAVHSDGDLKDWYRRSLALVFPSLWEGFGLPLLEALAAGTCVVASDIPVFRELVGDGFEPFDPQAVDSLVDALQRILDNPAHRQQRIDTGRAALGRFHWRNTVDQTVAVYRRLATN